MRVATFNVNGVRSKRADIRELLHTSQVDAIGLQETLVGPQDWVLRVPGYHAFNVCGGLGEAQRGVSILLKKDTFSGYAVGASDPQMVCVRAFSPRVPFRTVFVSVYVPRTGGRAVMDRLGARLQWLRDKFPTDALIAMGDWNRRPDEVNLELARWTSASLPLARAHADDRHGTTRRSARAIDHIVKANAMVGVGAHVRQALGKVLRDVDLSDHFPVVVKLGLAVAHATQLIEGLPDVERRPGDSDAALLARRQARVQHYVKHGVPPSAEGMAAADAGAAELAAAERQRALVAQRKRFRLRPLLLPKPSQREASRARRDAWRRHNRWAALVPEEENDDDDGDGDAAEADDAGDSDDSDDAHLLRGVSVADEQREALAAAARSASGSSASGASDSSSATSQPLAPPVPPVLPQAPRPVRHAYAPNAAEAKRAAAEDAALELDAAAAGVPVVYPPQVPRLLFPGVDRFRDAPAVDFDAVSGPSSCAGSFDSWASGASDSAGDAGDAAQGASDSSSSAGVGAAVEVPPVAAHAGVAPSDSSSSSAGDSESSSSPCAAPVAALPTCTASASSSASEEDVRDPAVVRRLLNLAPAVRVRAEHHRRVAELVRARVESAATGAARPVAETTVASAHNEEDDVQPPPLPLFVGPDVPLDSAVVAAADVRVENAAGVSRICSDTASDAGSSDAPATAVLRLRGGFARIAGSVTRSMVSTVSSVASAAAAAVLRLRGGSTQSAGSRRSSASETGDGAAATPSAGWMADGAVGPAEVDLMAEDFAKAALESATELGLVSKPQGARRVQLPRAVGRAIARRRAAFATARSTQSDSEEGAAAWAAYRRLQKTAAKVIRQCRRRRFQRTLARAAHDMRHDPRGYWQWASSFAGWRRKDGSTGTQPVKDPDTGRLCTSAADISAAWRKHYGRLAADVTGNSRNAAVWPERLSYLTRREEAFEELDDDIDMAELRQAAARMKNNRAPGSDGIPSELFKVALGSPEEARDWPMARALLRLCNAVWQSGLIPETWCDSVVVSIPKKGALDDMGNYRGISLMPTALKLVVTVLHLRMNNVFEAAGLFTAAQAGFRFKQECVLQYAALRELEQRRTLLGKRTYIAFVDLKKAYDTVPHEALFYKLERLGVRGRTLRFIRALYARSRIVVRTGLPPHMFSAPAPLRRGLRQGCTLSPLLFNVFINDILDGQARRGAGVYDNTPKVPRPRMHVPGLLFADDVATTSGSRLRLVRLLDALTAWLDKHEMAVGIGKCGLMVCGGDDKETLLEPYAPLFKIQGQRLPLVDAYDYLGLVFGAQGHDREAMIAARLEKGRRLSHVLAPFLGATRVPLNMRVSVVRTVLLPVMLFGAEIVGEAKAYTSGMQVYLNRALRALAGLSKGAGVSNVALWREFGIPPICASAAARRARGMGKLRELPQALAHELDLTRFKSRRWTLYLGNQRWLNRYLHRLALEFEPDALPLVEPQGLWRQTLRTTELSSLVQRLIWSREDRNHRCTAEATYTRAEFPLQPLTAMSVGVHPMAVLGVGLMVRCRLGFYPVYRLLARQRLVAALYKTECPFCERADKGETIPHMLLRCVAWGRQRHALLRFLIVRARRIVDEVEQDGAVDFLAYGGVGSVAGGKDAAAADLLLGGRLCRRSLRNWGFQQPEEEIDAGDGAAFAEGGSDASSSTGASASSSETGESSGSDQGSRWGLQEAVEDGLVQTRGCLAVAVYLSLVHRERARRTGAGRH